MIGTILTHFYPDIDAIMGVWLLKRHGSRHFPGVDQAQIRLVPAGSLPTAILEELEQEAKGGKRFLAVDTGHRDFDTHGQSTADKSAALLIAKTLGVWEEPLLQPLLDFVELNEATGESLAVGDTLAQHVLWPNLIRGIHLFTDWTKPVIFPLMFNLLDAAVSFADFQPDPVLDFWGIVEEDRLNTKITNLLLEWWQHEIPSLPPPYDKASLQELLGMGSPSSEPACPLLHRWLNDGNLYNYLHNRQQYGLAYVKNSLLSCLVAYAEGKIFFDGLAPVLGPLLQGLILNELEWGKVTHEIEAGQGVQVYPFKTKKTKSHYNFVFVENPSPLLAKAVRHKIKHTAIMMAVNPAIHTVAVNCSRPGPLQHLRLNRLASLLRRGEAYARGLRWTLKNLEAQQTGDHLGWYLHDSERMLMRGSLKSPPAQATRMTKQQLVNLMAVFLDEEIPLSDSLGCPGLSCRGAHCLFYGMHLPNCQQIQMAADKPIARALLPLKIGQAKKLGVY